MVFLSSFLFSFIKMTSKSFLMTWTGKEDFLDIIGKRVLTFIRKMSIIEDLTLIRNDQLSAY